MASELSAGDRYGRLTVVREVPGERSGRHVLCSCRCGSTTVVRSSHLRSGNTKSCGCLKRERASERLKTHGQSGTKIHFIWIEMRRRCQSPDHQRFGYYGGRGISVCDEWEDFEPFYEWAMANGYEEGLSIDRIDNDGDYEPDNCRWVDQGVQVNNSRNARRITYNGKTQSLKRWADDLGLNYYTLRSRLRIGWSVERAFETPTGRGRGFNGA